MSWWRQRRRREQERVRLAEESAAILALMQAFNVTYPSDPGAARATLREIRQRFPHDPMTQYWAHAAYDALGDKVQALTQLAILLALTPSFYAAHVSLARKLAEQGDTETATQVLEVGWHHAKKSYPKNQQPTEKKRFFEMAEAQKVVVGAAKPDKEKD